VKQLSAHLVNSSIFERSRLLWQENQKNRSLSLTKLQKFLVGIYLIIHDYSEGKFPPIFADQQKAYDAEINSLFNSPGLSSELLIEAELRKPFWFGNRGELLTDFIKLRKALEKCQIKPPQKILEIGCGMGWMSEFLAIMNYVVVATTISPYDIEQAKKRIASIQAKGISSKLEYRVSSMESVGSKVEDVLPFDAVLVYEALHHAYDWHQSIQSAFSCLKPGGWLIICNEPNVLHTYTSYRIARLLNIHEIGFSQSSIITQLRKCGFQKIIMLENQLNLLIKPHWIAAQK
jgi:2-polyprenyl-3-methyl-5-hydroxy-6-metoxy-1,4-benzoquinol methylase